jgi:hypothetical protein
LRRNQTSIYQAIRTRYHGPSDVRGSRIVARAEAGSVTVGYDHSLNLSENHAAAARVLIAKFGWDGHGPYFGGVFNSDYYWVSVPSEMLKEGGEHT